MNSVSLTQEDHTSGINRTLDSLLLFQFSQSIFPPNYTLQSLAKRPICTPHSTVIEIKIKMAKPNESVAEYAVRLTQEAGLGYRFVDIHDKSKLNKALVELRINLDDVIDDVTTSKTEADEDPNRVNEKKLHALTKFVRAHDYFGYIEARDMEGKKCRFEGFDKALIQLERNSYGWWMDKTKQTATLTHLMYLRKHLSGHSRVPERW